jgi:hypothetical protein
MGRPEVSLLNVGFVRAALEVEVCDPAAALEHVRPWTGSTYGRRPIPSDAHSAFLCQRGWRPIEAHVDASELDARRELATVGWARPRSGRVNPRKST